jgi:hypothetical protein
MLRRRALKLLFLALLAGLILRLTGVVEIPARWLVAGLAVELLLAWIEAAIILTLARRVYRSKRRTLERFEALVETLREIEPAPLASVMEKELRAYRQAYRLLVGRALPRTVEDDGEPENGEAGKREQGRRAERRPAVGPGQLRDELRVEARQERIHDAEPHRRRMPREGHQERERADDVARDTEAVGEAGTLPHGAEHERERQRDSDGDHQSTEKARELDGGARHDGVE